MSISLLTRRLRVRISHGVQIVLLMAEEMTQNAEDEARELLVLMRRINPEDPSEIKNAYRRSSDAFL